MKKVIIIGGGISGLTAGILLQKKGFKTVIYEKK
ncbi:MAG: NAD(P)-binding protein [Mollicutes bacterium]|nr:NAD(P)-binding protein [Mollicutes bacterium]